MSKGLFAEQQGALLAVYGWNVIQLKITHTHLVDFDQTPAYVAAVFC